MKIPFQYAWILDEPGPKMLIEALQHVGLLEHKGLDNNVNILGWAKEVGVAGWYTADSIPWCGLFMAIIAKRAGHAFLSHKVLAAIEWLKWGKKVLKGEEKLGDVLIFSRPGGNHVGLYVAENKVSFLVLGGNQSDSVSFSWIAKSRLVGTRRPLYNNTPNNIRKIVLNESGNLSTNEQ